MRDNSEGGVEQKEASRKKRHQLLRRSFASTDMVDWPLFRSHTVVIPAKSAAAPSQNNCFHNPSRLRLGINDHEAPPTSIIRYVVASHHRRPPPTQTSIDHSIAICSLSLPSAAKTTLARLQPPLHPSCSGLEVRYLQFSHFSLTSRFSSAVAENRSDRCVFVIGPRALKNFACSGASSWIRISSFRACPTTLVDVEKS